MTPNELISIAANNIGDGGFVIVNRDEHMQFVNDVAHDLWSGSKAAHVVREYLLPSGISYMDLPHDDIIEFVSLQIRAKNTPLNPPDDEQGTFSTDALVAPQMEKPPYRNIEEGYGIWKNIGSVYPKQHLTPEFRNGRYRIHSPVNFTGSEVLTAHCVIHSARYQWLLRTAAVDPTAGDTNIYIDDERIWEPFRNLFIEGCTWRAARRTLNFTMDATRTRIQNDARDMYYKKYLPDAIHFVHSLKDSTAALHVIPFRYLDE